MHGHGPWLRSLGRPAARLAGVRRGREKLPRDEEAAWQDLSLVAASRVYVLSLPYHPIRLVFFLWLCVRFESLFAGVAGAVAMIQPGSRGAGTAPSHDEGHDLRTHVSHWSIE